MAVHLVTPGLRFGDELRFQGRQLSLQGAGEAGGGGGGGSQQCQCAGGVFNGKEIITQQNVAFVMKKEARPITAVSNCSL